MQRTSDADLAISIQQRERALSLLQIVEEITGRGNNAEIRRKKDGSLTVYEVKKKIVTV